MGFEPTIPSRESYTIHGPQVGYQNKIKPFWYTNQNPMIKFREQKWERLKLNLHKLKIQIIPFIVESKMWLKMLEGLKRMVEGLTLSW